MLTLRTGRWHECQCCNCQASPVGWQSSATSKRTHLLLVGSPCLHYCNTKPSLPRTSPPSNLRNQHCNRMAWRMSHSHRLDSDSPCRGLCNTIPSWPLTNQPANLRSHQRNCKDRPAQSAVELAVELARWAEGNRGGGFCSTTLSCRVPSCPRDRRHS